MADSAASTPSPPCRSRRWAHGLWRWVRRGLLVLAVFVLLYAFVLPWYVQRKIVTALHEAGLSDASIHVQRISPWRAELAGLQVGRETGLSVGSIAVTYEPDVMGTGKAHTVTLDGAELRMAIRDGKLDLGPLANFHATDEQDGSPFSLPVERVELRASSVVVEWNGQSLRFPLAGTIEQRNAGHLEFKASVVIAGVPITLNGTLSENGRPSQAATVSAPSGSVYQLQTDVSAFGQIVQLESFYNPTNGEVMLDAGLKHPSSTSKPNASGEHPNNRLHLNGNFAGKAGRRVLTLWASQPRWTFALPDNNQATMDEFRFTIRLENIENSWTADVSSSCRSVSVGNTAIQQLVLSLSHGDRFPNETTATQPAEKSHSAMRNAWAVALTTGPIEHKSQAMALSINTLNAVGELNWRGFSTPDFAGRLAIRGGSFTHTKSGVSVADLDADIPIHQGRTDSSAGIFKAPVIHWKNRTLPALAGNLQIQDGKLTAGARWPLLKEVPIDLAAQVNIDSLTPTGTLTARMPESTIEDESQLRKLIPGDTLDETDIDGKVSLDASLTFGAGAVTPRAKLTLNNVNLRKNADEFAVEGISGSVTLDSLVPTTLPDQELTVKKLKMKKLVLKDGTVAFRVESPDSILIERTVWGFEDGQGSMHIHALRYHPSQELAEFEAFIENINVKQWIALMTGDSAVGEGLMYGRVPIIFHTGKRKRMKFGRGFLYANPGTGWFQIKSRTWLDQAVGQALLDPGAIAAEVQARIKEGLGNFEYSYLTFDFVPDPEGLRCVLVVKGKSRNLDKPVNFQGITINIRGLEEAINANLGFGELEP